MTFGKAFTFLAVLVCIVILWPIPYCWVHGWHPAFVDGRFVCMAERH